MLSWREPRNGAGQSHPKVFSSWCLGRIAAVITNMNVESFANEFAAHIMDALPLAGLSHEVPRERKSLVIPLLEDGFQKLSQPPGVASETTPAVNSLQIDENPPKAIHAQDGGLLPGVTMFTTYGLDDFKIDYMSQPEELDGLPATAPGLGTHECGSVGRSDETSTISSRMTPSYKLFRNYSKEIANNLAPSERSFDTGRNDEPLPSDVMALVPGESIWQDQAALLHDLAIDPDR